VLQALSGVVDGVSVSILALCLATPAAAGRSLSGVPEPLKPGSTGPRPQASAVPLDAPEKRECAWPSRLTLALDEHGSGSQRGSCTPTTWRCRAARRAAGGPRRRSSGRPPIHVPVVSEPDAHAHGFVRVMRCPVAADAGEDRNRRADARQRAGTVLTQTLLGVSGCQHARPARTPAPRRRRCGCCATRCQRPWRRGSAQRRRKNREAVLRRPR
jgi:hypothetical protein